MTGEMEDAPKGQNALCPLRMQFEPLRRSHSESELEEAHKRYNVNDPRRSDRRRSDGLFFSGPITSFIVMPKHAD